LIDLDADAVGSGSLDIKRGKLLDCLRVVDWLSMLDLWAVQAPIVV
jgi:hypothetical protein